MALSAKPDLRATPLGLRATRLHRVRYNGFLKQFVNGKQALLQVHLKFPSIGTAPRVVAVDSRCHVGGLGGRGPRSARGLAAAASPLEGLWQKHP